MSEGNGPAYPIESVDRALIVILAFEESDTITIADISKRLGVSRSTVFRLLNLLEHRGFVRQDKQTKAFHRGPALLRAGLAAVGRSDLRASARPLLERVVKELDETAHLVVLQGSSAFFLDCVESSKMVRAASRVGTALPAHVTASGKILLAGLSDEKLDEVLSGKLESVSPRSKRSSASVRREVVKARERGWAINDGESEVGLRAVAVRIDPVDAGMGIDAAITVAGPAQRLDDRRMDEIAHTLLELTREHGAMSVPAPSLTQ